jgi:hypothetical protein
MIDSPPISYEEVQAIELLVAQPLPIHLEVNNYNQPVKTGDKGDKGDKGDTGDKGDRGNDGTNGQDGNDGTNGQNAIVDQFPLSVTTDGQTQFNVFSNPTLHTLLVNGVEYTTYAINPSGSNWHLVWSGPFTLQTTDTLLFRIFHNS